MRTTVRGGLLAEEQRYGFAALEDCDDSNPAIYPGASEICDGLDNDCNEFTDDSASDASEWYRDANEDGYGNSGDATIECTKPDGYVANPDDCDDGDSSLSPETTWYLDYDQDGYGGTSFTLQQCLQPHGYVRNADDTNAEIHPGADEKCDGFDNDCDTPAGALLNSCRLTSCGSAGIT